MFSENFNIFSNIPFIFANIGSGVSFLMLNNEKQFQRISGTSIGGGTFLGLCNLILGINDYE